MASSLSPTENPYLYSLLESCRPFLRGEFESIDKDLPTLIAVLRSVGAGECWHKHGSFLEHLIDVYKILKIWKAPNSVCLCGLFHSAYSNSYVNLAIFDPSTGRETVRAHVGEAAERLIHLFCIVPRQPLIHDDLLFRYTDSELVEHLGLSQASLSNAMEKGLFDEEEEWRKKLRSILPVDGVTVKHIKTGEDVLVSRRLVAVFLLMTMADFSDQLFNFQDLLFDNSNGRLEFTGNNSRTTLWPGDGKPGLWMNSVSRMGAIYTLIVREEEITIEQRKRNHKGVVVQGRDEEIELVIPPVFDNCTRVLDAEEQKVAREMYWEGVCEGSKRGLDWAEEKLLMSIDKNPFVGEPHVVLGQIYLSKGKFEEAEKEAEKGLRLILEWGSPWDKRMSWEGWVAWTRVLLMKAKEKSWPQHSWGILNLGLVRETLSAIFEVAREMEKIEKNSIRSEILKGYLMATLFYEPSTRTRLSFESAMKRLGGEVLTTENAREFSSAAKGETLEDTIRTVEGYSDIIVMRHFESGAARRAASTASIPIINAGDGPGQHPTQALLDVYTIEREIGKLDGIKVALVGDLAYGRTVRSLAYLLAKYQDVKIYFVSPDVVKMKDDIKDYLTSMGVQWEESADLIEVASKCDVVYQTRIQRERFGERVDLYEEARGKYIVDMSVVNAMQKHAVVMHPLPRLDEITVDVDADPRAAYFRQAKNGLYIRMALLKLLLLGW